LVTLFEEYDINDRKVEHSGDDQCLSLKMKPFVTSLLAALAFVSIANGQQFEVATLKPSAPGQTGVRVNLALSGVNNGMVTMKNVTLAESIQIAYGIVSDAQIVGPQWIKSNDVRFDIVAKAAPDTPLEALRVMTQNLAGRLKLVAHHEERQLPFLALVIANGGPKISHDGAPVVPLAKLTAASDGIAATAQVSGRIASVMSMEELATLLSRFERQTVIDMTGLEGSFRVVLQWTPDSARSRGTSAPYSMLSQPIWNVHLHFSTQPSKSN
jgi:uncharacterized protein (TIGR03435 family)